MKKVQIDEFFVKGDGVRTSNAREAGAAADIPGLWARFHAAHPDLEMPMYGVYSGYESDACGEFTVTAGTEVEGAEEGAIAIRSGTYLEFSAEGAMPAAIIQAWEAVWAHFLVAHPYARAYGTDFEQYSGPGSARICIGIRKSSQGHAACIGGEVSHG